MTAVLPTLLVENSCWNSINRYQASGTFHTETSHLFCSANQMTSFYLKCNTGLNWVKLGRCSEETPLRFWDFVLHKDSVILKSDDRFFNLRILVYACIKINMQQIYFWDNLRTTLNRLFIVWSILCLAYLNLFIYLHILVNNFAVIKTEFICLNSLF